MEQPNVFEQHESLRTALIEAAQHRPDLLPITRQALVLAQQQAPKLGLTVEDATGWLLLHELGKYVTMPTPDPRRIAVCDLPAGSMIKQALERWPHLARGVVLPVPATMIALIAWCELRTMPGGRLVSLHQRRLYMERHYSQDHVQFGYWRALNTLAAHVEASA
jgi:hypothetical protein